MYGTFQDWLRACRWELRISNFRSAKETCLSPLINKLPNINVRIYIGRELFETLLDTLNTVTELKMKVEYGDYLALAYQKIKEDYMT